MHVGSPRGFTILEAVVAIALVVVSAAGVASLFVASARAVGIAGGPDKCRYVIEKLGFDACIDHRAPDLAARLA